MKLFFLREDSLYKIFKTLEKIPKNKKVSLFIDEENQFFSNVWRGKQIKAALEEKKINATFIAKSAKAKNYLEEVGLQVHYEAPHKFAEFVRLIYLFFFNAKEFHLYIFAKRNYSFYIIFGFELCVVLGILYGLYSIILPSATVTIKPAYNLEDIVYNFRYYPKDKPLNEKEVIFIGIPYQTGYIQYNYTMTTNVQNIKYFQKPSHWRIKIINTQNKVVSLLKNTKLITDEGLLFQTTDRVSIPAKTNEKFGEAVVQVTALEFDAKNEVIGQRWNIAKDKRLYVKNLPASMIQKNIYAVVINDFTGWQTAIQSAITTGDIAAIKKKLIDHVQSNKKNIATKYFNLEDAYLLRFNDLMTVEIIDTKVKNQPGEKSALVEWEINARILIKFVQRQDIGQWVKKYLEQRPNENLQLITIDKKSLILYDKTDTNWSFIVPTRISTIWWYNFDKDVNGIKEEMRDKLVWVSESEAKSIMLTYPTVWDVFITTTPPRYNRLPMLKSRIIFKIQNPRTDTDFELNKN